MQFPFIGGAYSGRSLRLDSQDLLNLYPEKASPGAKNIAALIGTPGLSLWVALAGAGGVRGLLPFNDTYAVAVVADRVYRVTTAGVGTQFGTIPNGNTPVSMDSNGLVVMMVTGANGFILDVLNLTCTPIANPNFYGSDTVSFLDERFIFNRTGTNKFQWTGLLVTTIDGLDFESVEGTPDPVLSLLIDHREIWLFKAATSEVWFPSDDSDHPYARIPGAFVELGIAAKFGAAKMDNTVYWLAADERGTGTVQKANGYSPVRVSTHAVEYDIAQIQKTVGISDAVAYTYQEEGHTFFVLNFPAGQRTWAYDIASGEWHKRAWRDPVTTNQFRQRQWVQMRFAGKNIVGDWENGNLYVQDLDTYHDNGNFITRRRVCPHLSDPDQRMMFFSELRVDMDVGGGWITTPYTGAAPVDLIDKTRSPMAMLRWSNDGGKTWAGEMTKSFGKVGEYMSRVRFPRLGKARDRVYEFTISEPVKISLVAASSKATVGRF